MRVWDVAPDLLCDRHLLGEHNEIHAIWSVITKGLKGYASHPETNRWRARLKALYLRHAKVASEMEGRGFSHESPLDEALATGSALQDTLLDPIDAQERVLSGKDPECAARIKKRRRKNLKRTPAS